MTNHLTEPSPGDPVSATLFRELIRTVRANRIIQGRNVLLGRGPNGTVINVDVPRSGKSAAAPLHPWKIYGGKRPESGSQPSKAQRVYVPAESLVIDGEDWPATDIIGLTADEDLDDFYELDCLETLPSDTPSVVHLFVYREIDPESEGADPQTYAEVAIDIEDSDTYDPSANEILAAVPLFNVEISEEGVLDVNLQYQHSAIVVGGSSAPAAADVGCFKLGTYEEEDEEEGETTVCIKLLNTFIRIGGVWVAANGNESWETGVSVESVKEKFFALVSTTVQQSTGEPVFTTQSFDSFSLMKEEMKNPSYLVVPLYHFDSDGKVDVDFRIAPLADCFDIAEINYTPQS